METPVKSDFVPPPYSEYIGYRSAPRLPSLPSFSESENAWAGSPVPRKHNNSYGRAGRLKCDKCRMRRKKCNYDETRPEDPCEWCASNGMGKSCVKLRGPCTQTSKTTLSHIALMLEQEAPYAALDVILQKAVDIVSEIYYGSAGQLSCVRTSEMSEGEVSEAA